MEYQKKCGFCGDKENLKGNEFVLVCGSCNNYNFVHACNTQKKCLNLIHSRFCSGCKTDISANDFSYSLIKPDDDYLPKFNFPNIKNRNLLDLFVLNKKPLIRFNKNHLFFFENKIDSFKNIKINFTEHDIVIADKNILLIIKNNISKGFCFSSPEPIILPEIQLSNFLPIEPKFKSISGEGYLFWLSESKGVIYLNCTKISNNINTNIAINDINLINKQEYKIYFPDVFFENQFLRVYILTSSCVIMIDIVINEKTSEITMKQKVLLKVQSKLNELHFAGQKTFLTVFDDFKVLVTNAENNTLQNTTYTEDNIFNSLDKNIYLKHENDIRIISWLDNVGDKLKEIPVNQNFEISFCAYLEKSDVLFLIYRKPLRFDICIVKDFGLHKWLYDIESSSAQLLLIDNLLYFFLVKDNHNEISVNILNLNDYIN